MRFVLFFFLFANAAFAQNDSTGQDEKRQTAVLRLLDRATVWEGVRIKTEEIFDEKNVVPRFKIKRDKDKRRALVAALEGQFQVNVGADDIRSLKRAEDLADYIFLAQKGVAFFSKANFQGKVERLASDRKNCGENFDCLHFIGSATIPQGTTATLFSEPKFKGEQLVIDATAQAVSIASFFKIDFENTAISTTSKSLNWREEVRSIRIKLPEGFSGQ